MISNSSNPVNTRSNPLLLSIITVCLNNLEGLKKTHESIKKLENCYEWVIVDGMSNDGTLEYLKALKEPHIHWISERDSGLYDAMNKGIARSSGVYVIFINSGDEIATEMFSPFSRLATDGSYPDLIYGDSFERTTDNELLFKKARSHKWLWYGMFTHHQAMMYNRNAITSLSYQKKYPIGADYAFTAQLLLKGGKVHYIQVPVCVFEQGGLSAKQRIQGLQDSLEIRKDIIKMSLIACLGIRFLHDMSYQMKSKFPTLYNKLRFRKASN